jgi:hypothetical protein
MRKLLVSGEFNLIYITGLLMYTVKVSALNTQNHDYATANLIDPGRNC